MGLSDRHRAGMSLLNASSQLHNSLVRARRVVSQIGRRIAYGTAYNGLRIILNRILVSEPEILISGPNGRKWARLTRDLRANTRIACLDGSTDLAAMCHARGIRHINLLAVDGSEVMSRCLGDATELLRHARIDIIAASWPARYGSAALPTDILRKYGYDFYASRADGFALAEPGVPREHFQFAINERLQTLATGRPQPQHVLDLGALCRRHDIRPRGVVHVGAHEGLEWPSYQRMGISAAIFIEANPAVFSRLATNLGAVEGLALANCAIADVSGRARLHVTSADQCSSLLPLGRHLEYYPEIVETRTIDVPAWTLDDLIAQLGIHPGRFNLLNIDIQGAELQALKGARRLLASIEAINVEVNFEELYDGCAQIEDIDQLLSEHGFRRIATSCPFHPSWGDSFYLRSS